MIEITKSEIKDTIDFIVNQDVDNEIFVFKNESIIELSDLICRSIIDLLIWQDDFNLLYLCDSTMKKFHIQNIFEQELNKFYINFAPITNYKNVFRLGNNRITFLIMDSEEEQSLPKVDFNLRVVDAELFEEFSEQMFTDFIINHKTVVISNNNDLSLFYSQFTKKIKVVEDVETIE